MLIAQRIRSGIGCPIARRAVRPGIRLALSFALLALAAIEPVSAAEEVTTRASRRKPSGPYCGLHCVFALTQLFERPVDFRDLVKAE